MNTSPTETTHQQSATCPVCKGQKVVSWIKPGRSANDPYAYGDYERCGYCGGTGTVPACPCGDPAREDEFFCDEECAESYGCQVQVEPGEKCCKPVVAAYEEPYTPGRFKTECCEECAEYFASLGYRKVA